jgi:hypothetical protein
MVKSKKTNNENVLNIRVGFSRSAITLALLTSMETQKRYCNGRTLVWPRVKH